MIQVEASTWSSPRPRTWELSGAVLDPEHGNYLEHDQDLDEPGRLIQIKAFDLDHALAGTGLDLEVSRAQAFLMIWRVPDKLGP